ncbi:MAG: ATP-binding cassette domain-containing protein [Prevotella sp.]|nr:ATP-binding cassette domain-containing protein [Prevotella sp.]MCM1074533.1 ATP-binding cassette domain-containing protein [Ruminococcus sp.]
MSYSRVEEVLNSEESVSGTKKADPAADAVHFRDVCFKYPGSGSPLVLQNLNFAIPKGKVTALVGASGCGKSTLIKLLLGMYPPHQGHITVGNDNLADIDHDDWLGNCGAVLQGATVFSGTLLSNIALCDETPDFARVVQAAKTACLHDFIEGLPMGYHTRVGVAGVEMSGGQKQRLMIARAVYKNPQLLVLDEATSSLDAGNEAAIVGNLDTFFKGRTVVIAAHRLSTVSRADNILFIDSGRILEQGTHEELVNKRGGYYRLVRNQLELGTN